MRGRWRACEEDGRQLKKMYMNERTINRDVGKTHEIRGESKRWKEGEQG